MSIHRSPFWPSPAFVASVAILACPLGCKERPVDDAGHDHSTPIEVNPENAPAIQLEALEDSVSGHNLHVTLTNFDLAPEHASTSHVEGEGHMHVYVDGVKHTRMYTEWLYLSDLEDGEHDVRVELSANSHNPLAVDGEIIDAETTIITRHVDHDHGALAPIDQPNHPEPEVTLEVLRDAMSGWNLHAETTNFTFTPEAVGAEPVDGEGHIHLYVNGEKVTRMYGQWLYLDGLPLGMTEVRVELSANTHNPLSHDGDILEATRTIEVTEEDSHTHGDTGHDHDTDAGQ